MKDLSFDEIVYSICVGDIQDVAKEVLNRQLTKTELAAVKVSVADYIDWSQAIEHAIDQHVPE